MIFIRQMGSFKPTTHMKKYYTNVIARKWVIMTNEQWAKKDGRIGNIVAILSCCDSNRVVMVRHDPPDTKQNLWGILISWSSETSHAVPKGATGNLCWLWEMDFEYTTKACTCCKHCIYYTHGHGAQITKSWQHKDKRPKVESRLSWWQWSATVVWLSLSQGVGLIKSWKIHDILKVNCNQAAMVKNTCRGVSWLNTKTIQNLGSEMGMTTRLYPPRSLVNPLPQIWFIPPKWRNPPG